MPSVLLFISKLRRAGGKHSHGRIWVWFLKTGIASVSQLAPNISEAQPRENGPDVLLTLMFLLMGSPPHSPPL